MIEMLYEPFRHWSKTGSVYIMSDTHFGDKECKLMDPEWITPEEQVKRLNKIVHKVDTLILLGDVGDLKYAQQLHGYKVLLMGNHDTGKSRYRKIFDEVYEGPLFIAPKILLSHEPIHGMDFCMNIHGHDHDRSHYTDSHHMNLAANVCGYEPVSLKVLIEDGFLSEISDIHRITIDRQTENKLARQAKKESAALKTEEEKEPQETLLDALKKGWE